MRRWVVPWLCCAAAGGAAAEPARPGALGASALPGGIHAPEAETLPAGTMGFAATGGLGYRSGLVGEGHRMSRGLGALGLAYAPTGGLSLALELDGRYDRHTGVTPDGDGNYVGDPRLIARLSRGRGAARIGGQLTLWAPGREAPSIAASAISAEARALASIRAGAIDLGISAGFRLDNSLSSIEDPMQLRAHERVSLGVSDHHAVVGSARVTVPAGRAFLGAEASIELYVGGAPEPPEPMLRAGVHGGVHLGRLSLIAFAEVVRVPAIDAADLAADDFALIPYEPAITGGLGVQARFGGAGTGRGAAGALVAAPGGGADGGADGGTNNGPVIEYAELSGVATDEAGRPIAGATVTAKLGGHTATATTGADGAYTIARLPIGRTVRGVTTLDATAVEITISAPDRKPATATSTLGKGPNRVPKLELSPLAEPSELRAVVSDAVTGKPIAGATVAIEPGGVTATTGEGGTLSIQLAPGTYKATATAPGRRPQTLDVVVESHGVHIKNFELRKLR
ncbi:MAG TPA: carboxypeptidase regulatory-like domain-containing protein [Kofleriaceae bacterium]|nr:carboxypeptidase regulatory-like domain-containing protein [Kofleriaceae bacterium]